MKEVKLCITIYAFFAFVFLASAAAKTIVTIDVKPKSINPKKNGLITVAIITDNEFDATTVDPLTVLFGPDGATKKHNKGHIEDADSDGDIDLVLHFLAKDTGIHCGETSAMLTGKTFDNESIEGNDDIITVGSCLKKTLRKGAIPPKVICLSILDTGVVFSLAIQNSHSIQFADKQNVQLYAIQGFFNNDDTETGCPIDGSGYMNGELFHFHLDAAYYDLGKATMINQQMEGALDFSKLPANGSVGILLSDIDGNSQTEQLLLETPCTDMKKP